MRAGSNTAWLSTFAVGERRYFETSIANYPYDMRIASVPPARRPDSMRDWRFTASLFTAVSASRAGDVRYVICIERTQ